MKKMEDNTAKRPVVNNTDNAVMNRSANNRPDTKHKKSSALLAADKGRSAVDNARPQSRRDVGGSSPLTNAGPVTDYGDE